MPDSPPENWMSSSNPAPRSPETVAIPVETDVIVPISRSDRFGLNASRARCSPLKARSRSGSSVSVSMHGFHGYGRLGRWRRRRQFCRCEGRDVLGEGRQIVCDTPCELHSVHRELDPANQLGCCLEKDRDICAEALAYYGLDVRTPHRRRCEGAAHEGGPSRGGGADYPGEAGIGVRACQRQPLLLRKAP